MGKGSALLLAVAIGFAGLVFYFLATVSPIRVVKKQIERSGNRVYVVGEVENEGKKPMSVDLEVHYYDSVGHPLAQDKLSLDDLKPGTPTTFRSPERSLAGVADFSLYLNHGRNPYGN